MAHSSDNKENTVRKRTQRSCRNCNRYFLPRTSPARYVEVVTAQTWCSRPCYIDLFPQEPEKSRTRTCPYCKEVFIPVRKTSTTCSSSECRGKRKKERDKLSQQKARKDPKKFEARRKSQNKYHQRKKIEDPEYMENRRIQAKEYARERRANPVVREKLNQNQVERRKDPEIRDKKNKLERERRARIRLKKETQDLNPPKN